jgi:hypothetical protein
VVTFGSYAPKTDHEVTPATAYDDGAVARGTPPLVPLGYGKFVRADRVYALVPLEGADRGDGRRTLVHVDGIEDPIVASRSESAIARDVADALGQSRSRADPSRIPGQEALF